MQRFFENNEQHEAYQVLVNALSQVVSASGANINCLWLREPLAYHLVRCGFRYDETKATIVMHDMIAPDWENFDLSIVPMAERKAIAKSMMQDYGSTNWRVQPSSRGA